MRGNAATGLAWCKKYCVKKQTHFVATAVYMELSGQGNTSDDREESSKNISDRNRNWNGQAFDEDSRDAEENHKHAESWDKYRIIDYWRISGKGISNDIANQRQSK